jgi:hypothetical protein
MYFVYCDPHLRVFIHRWYGKEVNVKSILIGIQSFVLVWGSTAIALAEEEKKEGGGGYDSVAGIWYTLIAIVLIYGIYDSFFKPVD